MTETGRKPNLAPRVKRYVLLLAAWTLCAAPGFVSEAQTQEAPLVIGVELDYPPYSFLDDNGKPTGYNVELTKAIAKVMELDVEVKIGPWGDIRKALESGEIDAISGMFYSVERDKLVDFSPPYTIIHHAIFARPDSPAIETEEDLRGKDIIVMRGDIMHDYVMEQGLSDNPVLMDTQAGVLRLLASGEHDCALVAKLPGLYWSKELGLSNIVTVGPLLHISDYCYAVTEGNATLLAHLAEGLAVVAETGRHKEIYDKWLGVLEPRGVPLSTAIIYVALAVAPLLLLLAASVVWLHTLKRRVALRTEDLRENEERYRAIAEDTPVMICRFLPGGEITYVNDTYCKYFAKTSEDLVGRTFLSLIPEADRETVMTDISALTVDLPTHSLEHRVIAPGGEIRWQRWINRALFDAQGQIVAYQSIGEDVTERKRAEDALRFTQFSIDRVAEAVLWVGPDARFVSVNEHMCRLSGYSRDELLSMSVYDVDANMPKEAWADHWQQLKERGSVTFESHLRTKNGRIVPVEINTNYMKFEGKEYNCAFARDISERKRAEEALRFTQFSIDRVAEAAVWLGPDARFISVNEQMCRSSGYSRDELLSMSIYDVDAHMPKEEWPVFWREVKEGGSLTFESQMRTKDGRIVPVEVNANYIDFEGKEYMCAFARDITERKRSEEVLRESERKHRAVCEGAAEGILIADMETREFKYVNPAICRMLGYTEEELVQMKVDDIHREEDLKDVVSTFEAQARGEMTLAPDIPCLRKDGTIMYADISSNPLLIDEKQCVLGLFSDITERKLTEENQRRFEEQVQRTQRFESLGVLAGGVAHDFNNLLTSILGNADMALETLPEASPAWQRIAHIEKASLNAADLCSQMLAYAGKGRFIVEPTDLNAVVKEMSHLLRTSISKDIVLDLVFEDELPMVEADATQMQQVVMNLVTNASEAVGEKGGVVKVITGVTDCDSAYLGRSYSHDDQAEGRYVYIEVADTGCGMDEQTQAKMFEPFFTTKFAGRGLGLAAVLGIIRGHGGAIMVDSQSGKGTNIRVLFPALDHYEPVQTEPQQNLEDPVYTFSGTVLVVDDEESVREIGKFMLETAGFDVITAEKGYEALEMYRKNADVIVCVLLDLTMPHMDGIKVFEQMRSIRDDVRVVLASGYSEEEISKRYAGTGIAGFIHKPYLFSTLKAKLHEALHKQPST